MFTVFFAELIWHTILPYFDLQANKYISLPGIFDFIELPYEGNFTKNDILTMAFMLDNYKENKNSFQLIPNNCSNLLHFSFACLSYSNNIEDEYIFLFDQNNFTTGRSWKESAKLCHNIGGYLPQFESKEKLNAFVALIKSEDIPVLEAIYIGLQAKFKVI